VSGCFAVLKVGTDCSSLGICCGYREIWFVIIGESMAVSSGHGRVWLDMAGDLMVVVSGYRQVRLDIAGEPTSWL
jgi:hypothetical protein